MGEVEALAQARAEVVVVPARTREEAAALAPVALALALHRLAEAGRLRRVRRSTIAGPTCGPMMSAAPA